MRTWCLAGFLGFATAMLVYSVYNLFPDDWLRELDEEGDAVSHRRVRRLSANSLWVLSPIFCVCLFLVFSVRGSVAGRFFLWFYFLLCALVWISDVKNRVIPNLLPLFFVVVWAAERVFVSGSAGRNFIFDNEWIDRSVGALAIPLLLFLIASALTAFSGREHLGFGDIKLLFACGLVVGAGQSLLLLFLSVCFSLVVMVPRFVFLVFSGKFRGFPKNTTMHFADDPAYFPLGPSICLVFFVMKCLFF